jgi:hypothetical protein
MRDHGETIEARHTAVTDTVVRSAAVQLQRAHAPLVTYRYAMMPHMVAGVQLDAPTGRLPQMLSGTLSMQRRRGAIRACPQLADMRAARRSRVPRPATAPPPPARAARRRRLTEPMSCYRGPHARRKHRSGLGTCGIGRLQSHPVHDAGHRSRGLARPSECERSRDWSGDDAVERLATHQCRAACPHACRLNSAACLIHVTFSSVQESGARCFSAQAVKVSYLGLRIFVRVTPAAAADACRSYMQDVASADAYQVLTVCHPPPATFPPSSCAAAELPAARAVRCALPE